MGFLTNIVQGLSGGDQGLGFKAANANIQQPFSAQDIVAQQKQSQDALAQQQAFTHALNTGQGLQGGAANLQNTYGQLQGVANGTGPNPAQAALQQATGQNIASQGALMAGQRGTGANAGMLARQAAQQGGQLQQQAAGQGATLQAQQSLNAMGQMGGIAGQQAGMQQNAVQGMTGAQQNQQQLQQQQLQSQNSANVANQANVNNVNAGMAQANAGAMGNVINKIGGALPGVGALMKSGGGGGGDFSGDLYQKAGMMAEGGEVKGPKSHYGRALAGGASAPMFAHGGGVKHHSGAKKVDALVSPGEQYLSPKDVDKVAKGKDPLSVGEKIPGKAKVKGNSYANDTVPKQLEEGGIVLPKSVMESKHPHWAAHQFVSAIMAKKGRK